MLKRLLQAQFLSSKTYSYNNYLCKRLAGHSKWANIKHTKELNDTQRGKTFTKLSQYIKVAIQEGGSINPDHNVRLAQVIKQAKRANMPSGTIESVIKSTQKDKTQFKSYTIEIRGPGNCIIVCEIFSPNIIKTKQDISTIMKKHKYSDASGHMFNQKGVIETEIPAEHTSKDAALEIATNHAIECEAEDVTLLNDSTLQFECEAHSFWNVQKNLEKYNYKIKNANLEYVPVYTASLNDSELENCSMFFDKLENIPEVIKLHDNIV